MRARLWILLAATFALTACDGGSEAAVEDGADDAFLVGGKADNGLEGCAVDNVLRWVNGAERSVDEMKAAGVHTRAAKQIWAYRAGADGLLGTDDDKPIDDLATLDDIRYVGPVALRQLVAAAGSECPSDVKAAVIFSPQVHADSHVARVADEIDRAQRSVDIAMYSFRDRDAIDALARAVDRGVAVRLVFEGARDDQRDPEGTRSAQLEALGVDVRYINKIMHHKFAIIDGPQNHRDEAAGARLVTGSANWSSSAATRYDENTVFLENHPEAALRFQIEFNHLWENSRSFESNPDLTYYATATLTEDDVAALGDDPAFDVAWTSANFTTYVSNRYGPTFGNIRGSNAVADRVVALIGSAERSIHIASGHLRSRPISEALMAAAERDPDLDIRVYLDNQEYVSAWSHDRQVRELDECLAEAGDSEAKTEDCLNKGFRFGYAVARAGVAVRYKYYHYKWDVLHAAQMHHKYVIVDGETLATGSYNFSDNAEHNTIENMVVYRASAFPELVAAYEANFEAMWVTGEAEGRYDVMLEDLADGEGEVPLQFEPMALDWNQVTALRKAIRDACPEAGELPRGTKTCTP